MLDYLWAIPCLPLFAALLNGVFLRGRVAKPVVNAVAVGSVGLAALLAVMMIGAYMGSPEFAAGEPHEQVAYSWIQAGTNPVADGQSEVSVDAGFRLDPLSAVMLFVVTFVGFLIHVYSVGYMAHEDGYQRYFTYLNLFMGAMLLLVLGNNYLVMFVGWEGVGLCSYLLIGFYFKEEFPPYAGRKAFLVNRIGDFAFIIALFALVSKFGTLNFSKIFHAIEANPEIVTGDYLLGMSFAGFVTLCLFIGATGKSAQIPLYVWLPDAMAGPTPVSALIHAATMVTAGVYMVVRSNALYQLAPGTSAVVAIVGCLTAVFAATIAMAQTDIKKVLAYSTVSQLGYMFLAAGVGAYSAAIFHLGTHAFFKALLFLGSGSVIHAMGGEQDMRHMGGLRKWMPATFATFSIGTLAIAGIPPLAGFFSKDQILASTFEGGWRLLWVVGLITAGLTAFYMSRAVWMTFFGEFRGTEDQEHHLHESPPVMTWPLRILALGAVLTGFLGMPKFWGLGNWIDGFLSPVMAHVSHGEDHGHHLSLSLEWGLLALSVLVAVTGLWLAWRTYGGNKGLSGGEAWVARFPSVHRVLRRKYFIDEFYDATVVRGTWATARSLFRFDQGVIDGVLVNGTRHVTVAVSLLSGFFDRYVVDGLVNFSGWISKQGSKAFRGLQTGNVSQYALTIAIGLFALILSTLYLWR